MRKDSTTAPKCFGKINSASAKCRKCEFQESCTYWNSTAASVESQSKLTSFEEIQEWLPDSADFSNIPGNEPENDERSNLISMLGRFFRFLLELDDYTMGIICEIIKPSGETPHGCTVSYLGKIHGCSRQAMHRKILDIIARKPELTALLKNTMYKLSRGRQNFIRHRGGECTVAEN